MLLQVRDPETKGEGINAYVSYRVLVRLEDENAPPESTVERRYSDFLWLRERLQKTVLGVIVPPLPHKGYSRTFDQEFIEERRAGLQAFLRRIQDHSHLRSRQDFHVFLQGSPKDLEAAKAVQPSDPLEIERPTKAKGFGDYFRDAAVSLSSVVGLTSPVPQPKTEADVESDAISDYALRLRVNLSGVSAKSELLIQQEKVVARAWNDFGMSATMLGQFEGKHPDTGQLGADLQSLGKVADQVGVLYSQKASKERHSFFSPFQDYVRITEALQDMMKTRENALRMVHEVQCVVDEKREKVKRYQDTPSKHDRVDQARAALEEEESRLKKAQTLLEDITQRCFIESERFKREKQEDLHEMLKSFVMVQIEHAKKEREHWSGLLESIDSHATSGDIASSASSTASFASNPFFATSASPPSKSSLQVTPTSSNRSTSRSVSISPNSPPRQRSLTDSPR